MKKYHTDFFQEKEFVLDQNYLQLVFEVSVNVLEEEELVFLVC